MEAECEAVLSVIRRLPAGHAARGHAAALLMSLGPEYWTQSEVLLPAAWHFAAIAVAEDPAGLSIQRSAHAGDMHADLEVCRGGGPLACFTWTSGTRVLMRPGGTPSRDGDFLERFLMRRRVEEKRIRDWFDTGYGTRPMDPRVLACLVIRAATDPSLGWTADIGPEDGPWGDREWLLGPECDTPLVIVDVERGTVRSASGRDECSATEFELRLHDPLHGLEQAHEQLRRMGAPPPPAVLEPSSIGGDLTDRGEGEAMEGPRSRGASTPGMRDLLVGVGSAAHPEVIIHADWGVSPQKRFAATARRTRGGWLVEDLGPWSQSHAERLHAYGQSTLAGFDFPIGLPRAFAEAAGIASFREVLPILGEPGPWEDFFRVCETDADISLRRPFYPRNAPAGSQRRRAHLSSGLGIAYSDLLRACERSTSARPEASCLFWLIGAKQVGRGAITGWTDVVIPAVLAGAKLWPFDGTLAELLSSPGPVLAETYPAEFYAQLGLPRHGWSKTSPADRGLLGPMMVAWARAHDIEFAPAVLGQVEDGFGDRSEGEDAFDAVVGCLGMIKKLSAGGLCTPEGDVAIRSIEGWILGMEATASVPSAG